MLWAYVKDSSNATYACCKLVHFPGHSDSTRKRHFDQVFGKAYLTGSGWGETNPYA